jgi:uncharacterized protein
MSTPSTAQPAAKPPMDMSKVAPWWHTILFIVGMSAYGVWEWHSRSQMAAGFNRSRLLLYGLTIGFELFLLSYVWFLGVWVEGKRLRDIIGGKWSKFDDVAIDIAVVFAFWIAVILVLLIVQKALGIQGSSIKAVKYMFPQSPFEMIVWVLLAVTAGFCEETVFRGYLQRQFLAVTRNPWVAAVLQAFVFGWVHLYQGAKSAIVITVYGIMFGLLAAIRKSTRPGMIQHASQDSLAGILGSVLAKHKLI